MSNADDQPPGGPTDEGSEPDTEDRAERPRTSARPALPPILTRRQATVVAVALVATLSLTGALVISTVPSAPDPSASPAAAAPGASGAPSAPAPAPSTGSPSPAVANDLPVEGWAAVELPPVKKVAELAPAKFYPRGISPKARFTLTSLTKTPAADLAKGVTVDPPIAFAVKHGADPKTVTLAPTANLAPNREYRFTLRTGGLLAGSWVFRTTAPPQIVGTLPRDAATAVPVETGIEITFDQDGIGDIAPYFAIAPGIDGRFEQHGRTWVFIPKHVLDWATIYTVRVRHGVPLTGSDQALAADTAFAFETVPKPVPSSTPSKPTVWLPDPAREVVEVDPNEAPLIAFEAIPDDPKRTEPPQLDVAVYRFATFEDAIDAFAATRDAPRWARWSGQGLVPTGNLALVASFSAALEETEGIPGSWIRFPDRLERGWYLVAFKRDGRDLQVFLQVTDLATFAAVTSTDTLVWVNDVTTGQPATGASVRFRGMALLGRTDADGVTSGTTPTVVRQDGSGTLIVRASDAGPLETTKPGRAAFVPVGLSTGRPYVAGYSGWDVDDRDRYHHALYIDRYAYRRTDQIDAWGLIRDRATGRAPTSIELVIQADCGSGDQSLAISRTKVKVDRAVGTFKASIPLEDLPYSSYCVEMLVDGESFDHAWFSVEEIVKPNYRIEVEADRHVVVVGDPVAVTATATFFEDTPAAGVPITIHTPSGSEDVKTDPSGTATVHMNVPLEEWPSRSWYEWAEVSAWAGQGAEEEVPVRGDTLIVFPSSVWLTANASFAADRLNVAVTTTQVDVAAIERAYDDGTWDGEARGVSAPGTAVTVAVTEVVSKKIRTGSVYDFIAKRTIGTYRWETRERDIGTFRAKTGPDGTVTVSVPVAVNHERHRIHVVATDPSGRVMETTLSVRRPEPEAPGQLPPPLPSIGPSTGNGLVWPHLADDGCDYDGYYAHDDVGWRDYYGDYGYYGGYGYYGDEEYEPLAGAYRTGDTVQVPFNDRDGSLMPEGGSNRYLFYLSQLGLRETRVLESAVFLDTFRSEWAPNTSLGAVRFTGKTYLPAIKPFTLYFDASEKEITVSVTTDAERYRPGGRATVSVTTTDEAGRPVDATIFVRVIDERLYAMGEVSDARPLPALYQPIGAGIIATYATHQVPVASSGGCYFEGGADTTGGGGGPPPWRDDFRDSLLFARVKTGADGVGAASFDLSDDLTSWHVSAAAVTADLSAGSGRHMFAVGLPFFIEAPVSTDLVAGDKPTLRVRAYGTSLTAASRTTYTVSMPGLGMAAQKVKATGYGTVDVPLPVLPVGEHQVRITAVMTSNGRTYQDALVRTARVVATRLTDYRTVVGDLRDGVPQAAGDGMTSYLFSDAGRGRYLDTLYQLAYGSGERVDAALAADLARQILLDRFDASSDDLPLSAFDGARYQGGYEHGARGIALLPYSSADLALSVRVAFAGADRFDTGTLREYFTEIRSADEETRERRAIALAGLAAIGDPVLDDIKAMLADPGLTIRERLYLALGAASLGDEGTALAVERDLLERHGERLGEQVRLRVGMSFDDTLEATALVALVGVAVGDPTAAAAEAYVEAYPGREDLYVLQQVAFIERALDRLTSAAASFTYTVGGTRHTVKLAAGECFWLRLTPDQRAGLSATRKSGSVSVAVSYRAPVDTSTMTPDPDVRLERVVVPASPIEGVVAVQVQLRATFGPQAMPHCYWVTDVVPSGLRASYDAVPPGTGLYESDAIWPWWISGDRVSFCAHPNGDRVVLMAYFARVVMPGSFRWEPAIVHASGTPERGDVVPETTMTIR